jgi:hypothetical protein
MCFHHCLDTNRRASGKGDEVRRLIGIPRPRFTPKLSRADTSTSSPQKQPQAIDRHRAQCRAADAATRLRAAGRQPGSGANSRHKQTFPAVPCRLQTPSTRRRKDCLRGGIVNSTTIGTSLRNFQSFPSSSTPLSSPICSAKRSGIAEAAVAAG